VPGCLKKKKKKVMVQLARAMTASSS